MFLLVYVVPEGIFGQCHAIVNVSIPVMGKTRPPNSRSYWIMVWHKPVCHSWTTLYIPRDQHDDQVSAALTPHSPVYNEHRKQSQRQNHPRSQLHLDSVYISTHDPYSSLSLGCTMTTTARLATVNANAMNDTRSMMPRLAGNFPSMTHRWLSTKRR